MSNYKLDAGNLISDPRECRWSFGVVGHDGNGKPILSPYATVQITRTWMTNAEYDEWYSKSPQDGHTAAVDVTMPAPDDGTFTEYTGCYLQSVNGSRRDGTYVYGVTIVVVKVAY